MIIFLSLSFVFLFLLGCCRERKRLKNSDKHANLVKKRERSNRLALEMRENVLVIFGRSSNSSTNKNNDNKTIIIHTRTIRIACSWSRLETRVSINLVQLKRLLHKSHRCVYSVHLISILVVDVNNHRLNPSDAVVYLSIMFYYHHRTRLILMIQLLYIFVVRRYVFISFF
jgi:hypothetical protein